MSTQNLQYKVLNKTIGIHTKYSETYYKIFIKYVYNSAQSTTGKVSVARVGSTLAAIETITRPIWIPNSGKQMA